MKIAIIGQQDFGKAVLEAFLARGDQVAVTSGVNPGDQVVSSGVFKLRNKMAVVENNELVPKTSEAPKPPDS